MNPSTGLSAGLAAAAAAAANANSASVNAMPRDDRRLQGMPSPAAQGGSSGRGDRGEGEGDCTLGFGSSACTSIGTSLSSTAASEGMAVAGKSGPKGYSAQRGMGKGKPTDSASIDAHKATAPPNLVTQVVRLHKQHENEVCT